MNDGVRRKNATRESTNTLKAWLNEHKKNPYPTKGEKIMLAIITKMTLTQVSLKINYKVRLESKCNCDPVRLIQIYTNFGQNSPIFSKIYTFDQKIHFSRDTQLIFQLSTFSSKYPKITIISGINMVCKCPTPTEKGK